MADNQNIRLTAEAWVDITIKEWVKKAAALGIDPRNPINADRFVHHVMPQAGQDPDRINIAFDYYLYFVDWGVGKGVSLADREMLLSVELTRRKQKPWFTSVFYKEVRKLANILGEKYADKAAAIILYELSAQNDKD